MTQSNMSTPAEHGLDDVRRGAHPHEVARLPGRHPRQRVLEDAEPVGLRLAHRQAADRQSVEADADEPVQGLAAQGLVHAALDDAEDGGAAPRRRARIEGLRDCAAPSAASSSIEARASASVAG